MPGREIIYRTSRGSLSSHAQTVRGAARAWESGATKSAQAAGVKPRWRSPDRDSRDVVVHDVAGRDVVTHDVKAFDYPSLITGEITQPNPPGLTSAGPGQLGGGAITHMGEVC
ncbi:hypothetical protein GCM10010221_08090 [Streptomyces parvus]|nr:hypothetical protein GCM10010221_08090 [Streptomyces parvus]